jgi:hypothetical protein
VITLGYAAASLSRGVGGDGGEKERRGSEGSQVYEEGATAGRHAAMASGDGWCVVSVC